VSNKGYHASGPPARARADFSVRIQKRPGDVLGAGLGNTEKGAVIFNIQEKGMLGRWNKAHPDRLLRSGAIITEVNGNTGYWSILEEFRRPGILNMKVTEVPPTNAGSDWFEEIAKMGKNLESHGSRSGSFMLRLQPQDPQTKNYCVFSSLPAVRAHDCAVDTCAICMDDVSPEDVMVQLPCQHAFHAACVARWLSESGERQCCPLCCRRVVSTPDGGLGAAAES